MNTEQVSKAMQWTSDYWDRNVMNTLMEYVKIPALSPMFAAEWQNDGVLDRTAAMLADWARAQDVKGMTVEIVKDAGRTPLIILEVPATGSCPNNDAILLYGHCDKQPPFTGWREGLGPWTPVVEGDYLYGRGASDDGYAIFAGVAAMKACQELNVPHARCIMLVETCEESGSVDLPYYVEKYTDRIGNCTLVMCLDSGCGNYDQLWLTSSLRGLVNGSLRVGIIKDGVHSGEAGGIIPDTFRIARNLLERLENSATGELHPGLYVEIPAKRAEEAKEAALTIGKDLWAKYPWLEGVHPPTESVGELLLSSTWKPQLAITGASGLPPIGSAGNVLRPETALRVSMRIPPTLDSEAAAKIVREVLEKDPPYGAHVKLEGLHYADGWSAPESPAWFQNSIEQASRKVFNAEYRSYGEGGSIPFIAMLGRKYPAAQFLVTGVLGPNSNAHGPNESLNIPYTKKLIPCLSMIMADHCVAHSH